MDGRASANRQTNTLKSQCRILRMESDRSLLKPGTDDVRGRPQRPSCLGRAARHLTGATTGRWRAALPDPKEPWFARCLLP